METARVWPMSYEGLCLENTNRQARRQIFLANNVVAQRGESAVVDGDEVPRRIRTNRQEGSQSVILCQHTADLILGVQHHRFRRQQAVHALI